MSTLKPELLLTVISQGDIIHQPAIANGRPQSWGFILTADCDIAKDKAGAKLSYLKIITANEFLEHVWAGETLRKMREKLVHEATALVTKAARALSSTYEEVSSKELLSWLAERGRSDIVTSLALPENMLDQYSKALERVELAYDICADGRTALQRLRSIWTTQNVADNSVRARLTQALDYNKATDFHLVPSLPGSGLLGFVVLLREVSSIPHANVYSSALEHQIAGNHDGFYIAGSTTDNLRYAISQKMAVLFSRIGMSDEYETQCETITELAVEEALSPLVKVQQL